MPLATHPIGEQLVEIAPVGAYRIAGTTRAVPLFSVGLCICYAIRVLRQLHTKDSRNLGTAD